MNSLIDNLLAKLGLPKPVRDILVHVVLVFGMAFAAQVAGASLGKLDWPTVSALLASAAAAGASAVSHYVIGLIPASSPAPATSPSPPSKQSAPKTTPSKG